MKTEWGTVTQVAHTETGYGSAWTKEHWVKTPADYAVIEQMTRHTVIEPDLQGFRAAREQAGDHGVALAWMSRTPFQRLWIENTGMERLAFDLMDAPAAVEACLDAFMEQSREIIRITAQSEANLVWVPDNITGEMTGPPIFRKYLAPYYRAVCDGLLPAGKLPCCHMDGMLRQIADCIAETDLPVMEALTPPPDGNFSVAEARDRWPEKALWLNFPSSIHLAGDGEIERVTRELVAQNAGRPGFLVGITENIPASVGARSLQAIGRALR
jgi:uroporphyrinogen-III decarboxylase